MSFKDCGWYIVSQCFGAVVASFTNKFIYGGIIADLGTTLPAGNSIQSFVLEMLLTCFLMFVIIGVFTGAKEKGILAGIAIGAVIALEATFTGPITGASMNPARSIGPALVSGNLASLSIYIFGPILGALLGSLLFKLIHN